MSNDIQSKISSVKRDGITDERVLKEIERSGNKYALRSSVSPEGG